jgi:hypothetical protein
MAVPRLSVTPMLSKRSCRSICTAPKASLLVRQMTMTVAPSLGSLASTTSFTGFTSYRGNPDKRGLRTPSIPRNCTETGSFIHFNPPTTTASRWRPVGPAGWPASIATPGGAAGKARRDYCGELAAWGRAMSVPHQQIGQRARQLIDEPPAATLAELRLPTRQLRIKARAAPKSSSLKGLQTNGTAHSSGGISDDWR